MVLTEIWEHGHAYQPRRIVDAIAQETRKIPNDVHGRLLGKAISAANWFELMLRPGGVYDTIVGSIATRSLDIEPLTLFHMARLNPIVWNQLWRLVAEGRVSLFTTTYCHPILPLLVSESFLDAKVNVHWATQYMLQNKCYPKESPIFFWLGECAYSVRAAQAVLEAIHQIRPSAQIFLLLDEFQGESIDPNHIYKLMLENGEMGLVFRSRWFSDAYAFSQDSEWLAQSIRADILRRRPDILGAAIDAETYGGAYDEAKPIFFAKIREALGNGVWDGSRLIPVRFMPIDEILKDTSLKVAEARLLECSSWSNYVEGQRLHPQREDRTGILARRVSPLCRWTGLTRENDGRQETYFTVYDWVDPNSRKWYTRIVSSLWKVAFETLRARSSSSVRKTVLEFLPSLVGAGSVEEVLAAYGEVVFETRSWDDYSLKYKIGRTKEESVAARLLLEAYRMTNQEAWMSDPTFWENMDTEVVWTALALIAAGTIQAAKACLELGFQERLDELAQEYRNLFLEFETSLEQLSLEYGCPIDILYEYLRERSARRGYHVERELSISPITEESARIIARKAYGATFNVDGEKPLKASDVNPYVILWKMHERRTTPEEAREALREACLFEWKKSIASAISKKSIPVRVGMLHARYFPKNRFFSASQEDSETDTEIISGEAQAYMH